MAKNESLETVTLVNAGAKPTSLPGGSAQYMRKDSTMLVDGVWYITTPCPALANGHKCLSTEGKNVDAENGLVDEEVSWELAKTPHHAGLIADRRHFACAKAMDDQIIAKVRVAEIESARIQVDHQKDNLLRAQERLETAKQVAEANPKDRAALINLEAAQRHLRKHEEGMLHAVKRLEDVTRDNTTPL